MEIIKKQITRNGLLNKIIENLIEERIFNIPHQRAKESTDYDKMEEELICLSNNVRGQLGSEQNLFMRYEELSTINENTSLRDTYKQGFIDGIALLREIMFTD